MKTSRRPGGLTLVETLASMAIIGTLATLLLPAIQSSRTASRRAACQSNMRQWSLAVLRFADEHHGDLPRRGQGVQKTERLDRPEDWFNSLPAYLESPRLVDHVRRDASQWLPAVWNCPELVQEDRPLWFSYGMNMWLSTWKSPKPDNLKSVGALSTMTFLADGNGTQCSLLPADAKKKYNPDPRHSGMANLAFLDGHVAAFSGDYLGCGIGISDREDVRWEVPDSAWLGPEAE